MRGAFVVQLGPETKPAEGQFEGWVEEVDSYMELRFRSVEELLNFLGTRFEAALDRASKARPDSRNEESPPGKTVPKDKEDSPSKSKRSSGADHEI